MVSRDEMLKTLHSLTNLDEGEFLFAFSSYLDEVKDENVRELLGLLVRDSSRHALMLDWLIKEVEENWQDDY